MPLYCWASFLNNQKAGPPKRLITDDDAKARAFIQRFDVPGRGVFSCPNPLQPGATQRLIDTVDYIDTIQIDIDYTKDLVETAEEVDTRLRQLPIAPTWVRDSGWGRHFVLKVKDPIHHSDRDHFERACAAWKRMVAAFNADPMCSHPACLFRVKGTTNSKHENDPKICRDLWGSGQPVDLTEIEELIEILPATGIFTPKHKPAKNGRTTHMGNGRKEPVNVDQRLADMTFEGPGQSSVHHTELSCTASLLRQNMSLDSVVLTMLEEMQKKLAGDPRTSDWAWAHEKKALEGQCFDFIAKHPELAAALPDEFQGVFDAAIRAGKKPRFIFNRVHGWQMRALTVVKGGLEANDSSEPSEDPKANKENDSPEAPRYRFKLVSFSDLRPGPEPLCLVDELIPLSGLVDIWGKAKCYKSFWCLDLMLHVAMGWEYRDRYVHQGAVVYCAFEGAHGYKKRVEALRRHYGIEEGTPVPLYVMPGQANLIAEHRLLIADISAQLGQVKPVAVVLDTLNKSLFGSESRDEDMGNYVRAAESIRDRFGCVVIIVHHCGWDDTRPRGHSSLLGAVDAQISVVRAEDTITVTVEMMRDGAEDTQVVSRTEVIEVGQDQNGKILTSLVVVPSDERAAYSGSERPPRGVNVLLNALRYAKDKHGEEFQPEPGVLAVRAVSQWCVRDRFYATYAESEEHDKTRQNKLRQAWHRALGECQTRGLIRTLVKDKRAMIWEVTA
jgi:hypothetical protein